MWYKAQNVNNIKGRFPECYFVRGKTEADQYLKAEESHADIVNDHKSGVAGDIAFIRHGRPVGWLLWFTTAVGIRTCRGFLHVVRVKLGYGPAGRSLHLEHFMGFQDEDQYGDGDKEHGDPGPHLQTNLS